MRGAAFKTVAFAAVVLLIGVSVRALLNKATAHSMLSSLSDAGWLVRDQSDKTYRLGPSLVDIGRAAAGIAPPQVLLALS